MLRKLDITSSELTSLKSLPERLPLNYLAVSSPNLVNIERIKNYNKLFTLALDSPKISEMQLLLVIPYLKELEKICLSNMEIEKLQFLQLVNKNKRRLLEAVFNECKILSWEGLLNIRIDKIGFIKTECPSDIINNYKEKYPKSEFVIERWRGHSPAHTLNPAKDEGDIGKLAN